MLCLSPFDKKRGQWVALAALQETGNLELLGYFLREITLLGGLCCGHNSLTLQTVRALYPFALCMEIVANLHLPTELRAAVCILLRQLYIESETRRCRPNAHSVWDWDALLCGDTMFALPPASACLSRPSQINTAAPITTSAGPSGAAAAGAASAAAGAAGDAGDTGAGGTGGAGGAGIGMGVGGAADGGAGGGSARPLSTGDRCALDGSQLAQLEQFVVTYIQRHAQAAMATKDDLDLMCGVLDLTLHLLRYGHLQAIALVQLILEKVVGALAVAVEPPADATDERARNAHQLSLQAKSLMCNLIEAILDFRLHLRVGSVLRRLRLGLEGRPSPLAAQLKLQPKSHPTPPTATAAAAAAATADATPTQRTSIARIEGTLRHVLATRDSVGGYERLAEEDATPPSEVNGAVAVTSAPGAPAPSTPASLDLKRKKLSLGQVVAGTPSSAASRHEAGRPSAAEGVNIYEELQRGTTVLSWHGVNEDMTRALVQTASEARGRQPELVADALRVLFAQFNQANVLSTAIRGVVLVRKGPPISVTMPTASPPAASSATVAGMATASPDEAGPPPPTPTESPPPPRPRIQRLMSERSQALSIARTVCHVQRMTTAMRALASTDPLPSSGAMLNNLTLALGQLLALCTTRHQRRLQRSLSAHEAVIAALRVLQEVEGSDEMIAIDGIYRLPPRELLAAREEAFDFLAAFCGYTGLTSVLATSAAVASADAPAGAEGGEDYTFSSRRDMFGTTTRERAGGEGGGAGGGGGGGVGRRMRSKRPTRKRFSPTST